MATYTFDGKVAFVTGAARGQGRSHAVRFAKNGADVVLADICETSEKAPYRMGEVTDLEETADMVRGHGQQALPVQTDVRQEDQVQAAVDSAIDRFDRIDFLVNNAGVAPPSALLDLEEATWNQALDVNLKGMWLTAKHVGRHLVERGDGGRIVNTSSIAGLKASPGLGHYTAAKHGVIGLTKTLAVELAPHDVTVNAVCPTAVDTEMTHGIVEAIDDDIAEIAELAGPDNLLGEIMPPEDVSGAFMWLCSEDARFVTGTALPVAAGATAL